MKAEKDPKTGKWLIQYRYTDWQGKRRKSTKRGFSTKREAEEWLRNFLMTKSLDFNMKFKDFVELYYKDMVEIGENTEELQLLVMDCIYLIEQLIELITTDATGELISGDFRTAQQKDEMSKDIKNAPAGNRDIEE